MELQNITNILSNNSYPGRGILLGKTSDGENAVLVYFIMGRSKNSRNRVFTEKNSGIITEAADPAKLEDPSLIIYTPVRTFGNFTIVTNGDQTDTIYDCLENAQSFEDALRTRTFEPDAPNYTPRISGLMHIDDGRMQYKLSILKSNNGNPIAAEKYFFEYPTPLSGEGKFIHTYESDGDPLPSFTGEPHHITLGDADIDEFGGSIWSALNEENKVSLFVRYIHLDDGFVQTRIYNKKAKV